MKYYPLPDGEWVEPLMRGYRVACCDCRLIHRIDFRVRAGRVQFRAHRDKRATAAARRANKKRGPRG